MCNSPEFGEGDDRRQMQLPLEIWEVILKNLQFLDLKRASGVCQQWRQLVKRIYQERCLNLPVRLLHELIHEYHYTNMPSSPILTPASSPVHCLLKETDVSMDSFDGSSNDFFNPSLSQASYSKLSQMKDTVDWMALCKMMMQTEFTKDSSQCTIIHQMEKLTHVSAAGQFVVCVSRGQDGVSFVLRMFGINGVELCSHEFSGRLHKVCVIRTPKAPSLLAICVDRELKCFLPVPSQRMLLPMSVYPEIEVDSRMCCDGTTLVIAELVDDNQLALYEITPEVSEMSIKLMLKCRISTSSSPLFWDLWNGFVTIVLSGGHVTTYTKTGNLVGESPMYKDLKYPNPTVLTHGIVFASTITSRTLLAYWHMDRDRDYWLVGRSVLEEWIKRGDRSIGNGSLTDQDTEEMSDVNVADVKPQNKTSSVCILTLAKIRIGSAVMMETTVIHYKRGLVFCGTDQGHILVYKVFAEDQSLCPKINISLLESSMPCLCMPVASRPISKIVAFFSDTQIIIALGDRSGKGFVVSVPNVNFQSL